jgi:hypothetical protein
LWKEFRAGDLKIVEAARFPNSRKKFHRVPAAGSALGRPYRALFHQSTALITTTSVSNFSFA